MQEENTKIINPDPTPLLLNKSDPKTNALSSLTSVNSPQHSFFPFFFSLRLPKLSSQTAYKKKEILSFSSSPFDRKLKPRPQAFLFSLFYDQLSFVL